MAPRISSPELHLFEHGLVRQLARRQLRPTKLRSIEAKLVIVVLAWLPLAALSLRAGSAFGGTPIPFARDFAVHVRLLFELPLLLFSMEPARKLVRRAIEYVNDSELVPDARRASFRALVASTRRASDTPFVPVIILALAWGASWLEMSGWVETAAGEASWRTHGGAMTQAGIWFALVSRPILYAQLGLWIYRFLLWSRVLAWLARVAKPIPAHPDGIGGLGPLNVGHDGFSVIALVVGADLAAGLANHLVHLGGQITAYRPVIIAIIVATTFLLLAPMLLFFPGLYRARVEALFSFHDAATVEARRIDQAIAATTTTGESSANAFKEHNHVANSLQRVRDMRLLPLHRRTLIIFVASVALPFALAALTQLSLVELIRRAHHLTELAPPAVKR